MKINYLKRVAFTLAETLIVIGIIGVIAALTIPSLTNETNDKEKVAKVKKAQAVLEDAFGRMTSQYGALSEWPTLNTTNFGSRISKSMKISKNCGVSTTASCFASDTKTPTLAADGETKIATANVSRVLLADGSSFAFYVGDATCKTSVTTNNTSIPDMNQTCGTITVDIDGPTKGKNAWGKDLFAFYFSPAGMMPMGFDGDTTHKFIDKCSKTQGGQGCTAWVVTNSNTDYLKTNSSGACTSNTSITLSWSNTTCDQ